MISQKTRRNIFLTILILLVLLLMFLLWWFLRPEPAAPIVITPTPIVTIPASDTGSISETRQQEEQVSRNQTASIQSASKTFAERYGSYSNEANFANLRDVIPLMNASFARETLAFVDAATAPVDYYAVTTRVISVSVDAVDEATGTATVTVTTQREEAKGSVQNVSVRYADLRLTFVTENGSWKVSSVSWL
ncbi:hypothetical protein A2348_00080 [Candidatus Uhrbacteria bacterium RIFOXYB12_FULL_58_10]|uniref:Uncharacterized protein n=1 Tax=Candidatus Uhrbacteria bacterium RIFOXYB2_FULL_57_15 TaxID=1802422 RepID=A0A1F7W8B4_9BACT|nr:MAG: hypothetical protein A2348_00080 [Candidatus Uhrbacteria bacterium RIFOXYB12_FULL_58_10]OGL98628.1 MAG: hypothetical protein A2304_02890 [Candidatus Uhrbacteria bacterium RIFOXYB2_FULL_57_15]OGM00076.1 MAG: hypothetical protein A2501_02940 [Candidatus Uhrbacteria bacterium RIFOXYC12_FULL_57_11]